MDSFTNVLKKYVLRFLPMVATVSDEFQGIGTLVQVIGHSHRESFKG